MKYGKVQKAKGKVLHFALGILHLAQSTSIVMREGVYKHDN
jgi:hypothetical protein